MPDQPPISRRRLLEMMSASSIAGLAGCGGRSETSNQETSATATVRTSQSTSTQTVVFTDSPTSSSDGTTVVFDGGGTEAFNRALETLRENPGATLVIEPGTYRFNSLPDAKPSGEYFLVHNLQDVTIEGNGARIVLSNPSLGFLTSLGGKDITLHNLTIDYDPVPFTQGRIIELSEDKRVITLELEEEYPLLTHQMFDVADHVSASIHMPDGQFISGLPTHGALHLDFSSIEHLGGRRFELVREAINPEGLVIGRRLAVSARDVGCLHFLNVTRPTIANVTIQTAPGMALPMNLCDGAVIRDVVVAPPPDSDRLLGSVGDGIHVTDGRVGPTIENCRLEQVGDDGIVVDAFMLTVTGLRDERTVELEGRPPKQIQRGDTFEILTSNGVRKGVLSSVKEVTYQQSPGKQWVPANPETLSFEDSISGDVEKGDFLINQATTNPGFVVRDNVVRNNVANSVRLAAGPGVVEGNKLDGSSLNGIWMRCDTYGNFIPARWTNDVLIRNNRISRSGLTYFATPFSRGVRAVHRPANGVRTLGRPHRNIVLLNNEIDTTAKTSVFIEDAENVSIESNEMHRPNQVYEGQYGVEISNVAGGTVKGNMVTGSSDDLSEFGKKRQTEKVESHANELVIDGESKPAKMINLLPVTLKFNTTGQGGNRYLSFVLHDLAILNQDKDPILSVDVGADETGVEFGEGVYPPEQSDDYTWRWLGGESEIATMFFSEEDLEKAHYLQLWGEPFEEGIEAIVEVQGERVDSISFGPTEMQYHLIQLG